MANNLSQYTHTGAIVLAIPRGGVPLGKIIAKELKLDMDLIIPRKIGHPKNPEFAVCAITETGHRVCGSEAEDIPAEVLDKLSAQEIAEAKRRRNAYLHQKGPLPVEGKTVIIVDDGMATGLTMHAAIEHVKSRKAKKIVVAVPVCSKEAQAQITPLVDDFVPLYIPNDLFEAVGAYYENFAQVTDEEVINIMEDRRPN